MEEMRNSTQVDKKVSDLQELTNNLENLRGSMNGFREELVKAHTAMFNRPMESDPVSERQVSRNKVTGINELVDDCRNLQTNIRSLTEDFIDLLD